MPYIPGTNIKVVGGTFRDVKGDLTNFDNNRHETNIDSYDMRRNKTIDSFNSNSKIIGEQFHLFSFKHLTFLPDDQRRENYTGPHPSHPQSQFMPHQSSSGRSRIENHDSFNMEKNRNDNAFNDYSETHCEYEFYTISKSFLRFCLDDGWAPPINQRAKARPKSKSIQKENIIPNIDEVEGLQSNGMPSPLQQFGQRMHQALSNLKMSEENAVPNYMPRNNDEDEDNHDDDDPSSTSRDMSHPHLATHPRPDPTFPMQVDCPAGNSNPSNLGPNNCAYPQSYSNPSEKNYPSNPLPVSTLSIGPIFRPIYYGNLTQHDNSVRQTNISSFNVEGIEITNSFNNISKGLSFFVSRYAYRVVDLIFQI